MQNIIESLENWVAWQYLHGTLNWPAEKVAYELNVSERRLVEWVNASNAEMNRAAENQPGKVKSLLTELQERYPEETPDDDPLPKIDIKKVGKMMQDGKTMSEIRESLKVPENEFRAWWNVNLPRLNIYCKEDNLIGTF